MMKMLQKKRKGGFTLIELIVVIAILAILIAIAAPRITGFTGDARTAAADATARTLNSATAIRLANGGAEAADEAAELDALIAADLMAAGTVDLTTVSFDAATDTWSAP